MRNLRILGSEKRLLGDHGSGKLKKVNIGETMEIQYDLDDRSKRDMTPEDYKDKMHIDLERSLVSNVYPESVLVTAEHVCARLRSMWNVRALGFNGKSARSRRRRVT